MADTLPTREITLSNKGMVAIVDAADFDLVGFKKWRAWQSPSSKLWYAVRTEMRSDGSRGTVYMHRRIMGIEHGDPRTVDHHKTCDTLVNTRANLRFATHCDQTRNQRIPADNTSGVKGVGWEESRKMYRATITVNYRQIFLGRRKKIEDAAALYRAAQIKYHGEFANFD